MRIGASLRSLATAPLVLMLACSGAEESASPPASDASVDVLETSGETALDSADGSDVFDAVDASDVSDASCPLAPSGPIVASKDGQVIEGLSITSPSGVGIEVSGKKNVVIRNCRIAHAGGHGISFSGADGLVIDGVDIVHTGAPAKGANAAERDSIAGEATKALVIRNVRLTRGSSGIYLNGCPGAKVSFVEGHDFRGPFPRGQLVQFDKCDAASLEDFSCENPPDSSWPEDIVSVYRSSSVTVRRGLVDGNNSTSGVGIMFELSDTVSTGGLVEDVDAVHQANGCFSAYPAKGVTFRRTRARDNFCSDQGRGKPLSNGLSWAAGPSVGASSVSLETSSYFNLCGSLTWLDANFTKKELTKEDFVPRPPLRSSFCFR
jgi:hypothetical protein